MIKDQGDGSYPDKKSTQSGERYQIAKSDKYMVIPGHYNPLEEVANINNSGKLHFTKLKPM